MKSSSRLGSTGGLAISAAFLNASHWRTQGLEITISRSSPDPSVRYAQQTCAGRLDQHTESTQPVAFVFRVNPPGNAHSLAVGLEGPGSGRGA